MINALGREIPDHIEGMENIKPFQGAFACLPQNMFRHSPGIKAERPGNRKLIKSMEELFKLIPIQDGMTLSFHHHMRNGDYVLNLVIDTAARLGIKGLKIAPSGLFPVHRPIIEHIKNGVVADIDSTGPNETLGEAISEGVLSRPVVIRSHGGRARAIECGQLRIDVAFIAAPLADIYGNISGSIGASAFGSIGYAYTDAEYAEYVVAVTDNLVGEHIAPVSIPQTRVDYIIKVDSIGDSAGIQTGTMRITRNSVQLVIADLAARAIQAAGLIKDGFSFQTGAGGISLAVAHYVGKMMEEAGAVGSFATGGITGYIVEMLEKGLFKKIFDVQSFDLRAVKSIAENPDHIEMSCSYYANPFNSGCMVNQLDAVILGAMEIDVDFNVNTLTMSDGMIFGSIGGHCDTAAGAKTTIVVANLLRGRFPIIVDRAITVTTPGETIDVFVTERGIAVNPKRPDLKERFIASGLPVKDIRELKAIAQNLTGVPDKIMTTDKIVALVEYRDGTIIDVIKQVKK